MAKYEWDTRCADLELARLERGFTTEDFTNFAATLEMGFQTVQNTVHVMTGRLRESGQRTVTEASSSHWEGEISFGGNGVKWAASEFFGYSDKHGGYPSHAYFRRVGWQPVARTSLEPAENQPGHSEVRWNQLPIANTVPSQGFPIEDDMKYQAAYFFSRGSRTPHPERGGA